MTTSDRDLEAARLASIFGDTVRLLALGLIVSYFLGFWMQDVPRSSAAGEFVSLIGLGRLDVRFVLYAALPAVTFIVLLVFTPEIRDRSRSMANRCAALVFLQNVLVAAVEISLVHR